jgi:predicted permease
MAELLFLKIAQLFVFMALGFIIVKFGALRSSDSLVLSKICLFILMPSAIINAFDVELDGDIKKGILLAFASAFIIHAVLLVMDLFFKKKFSAVERASIIYSNAGNMIIPIVLSVLGPEWVIYTSAFLSVQLFFMWTHGVMLFSKEKLNFKKIVLNVNIIAIALGVVMLVSGIRLPVFVKGITSELSGMLGAVGMLIAGMTAANMDAKKLIKNKRLYIVSAMRMILCPAIVFLFIKLALSFISLPNAENILLVSFLAATAPAASTVMQFAQIYGKDDEFAVGVNIFTTVLSILTMPVFVALF